MTATAYGFGTIARIGQIDAQIAELHLKKKRITANAEEWETETDEAMTARLHRSRTRRGMREARYRLNDEKQKPVKLEDENLEFRVFTLIYEQWKESGTGVDGVPLGLEDIADKLGCSDRHLKRVIGYLDRQLGLVVRIPGKPNRYAVSLPETHLHREAMMDTFAAHAERLQSAALIEAGQPNLELARMRGLERFQADDYTLPDGCWARLLRSYGLEQPKRLPYRLAA